MPARVWIAGGLILAAVALAYAALTALFPRDDAVEASPVAADAPVAAAPSAAAEPAPADPVPAAEPPAALMSDPVLAADIAAFAETRRAELPEPDLRATQPAVTLTAVSVVDTNLLLQYQVDVEGDTYEVSRPRAIVPGLIAIGCDEPLGDLPRFTPYLGVTCYEAEPAFYEAACADETISGFLRRGARVKYVYVDVGNLDLAHVELSSDKCA